MKDVCEVLAVFSKLNALWGSADDTDSVFLERRSEIQRCLAPELNNDAPALLAFVNI